MCGGWQIQHLHSYLSSIFGITRASNIDGTQAVSHSDTILALSYIASVFARELASHMSRKLFSHPQLITRDRIKLLEVLKSSCLWM